ncbi:MAG: dTDP-4-dehydrorhamnose 3,5-epimerase family protein [Candidatus Dojkabacteria bacterium]|nr:dTDP-4-dehydrorhamnose 3,5-epimerase family protein [Candidatus Dojkabacteria bacterium]
MIFKETPIQDVLLIEPEKKEDERGFFARTFDQNILFHKFINFEIKQTSISYNKKKGTLRGMHYQDIPYLEEKLVQCVKGSIYDVVLDIRSYSKTYNKWFSTELNDKNNNILYIPISIAHGFQTLEDDTTVLYYMNQEYNPKCSKNISYNDKKYNIKWKLPITSISDKDSDKLNK